MKIGEGLTKKKIQMKYTVKINWGRGQEQMSSASWHRQVSIQIFSYRKQKMHTLVL
jgi:hypothetical protein